MKKIILFFILCINHQNLNAQKVNVSSGKVQRIENFKSQYIDNRNIDVWLPEGYSDKQKYAVLYMHDGQALYDAETTWNKQSWEVDEIAGKLIVEKKTREFIVVGIWNNGQKRHHEYFPQKPYEGLAAEQKEFVTKKLKEKGRTSENFSPISDLYLKFLVTELKPFIDKTFCTKSNAKNTFTAGSSMGGLISIYAICEYPKVFGGVACLSTHWPGIFSTENNPVPDSFVNYLKQNLPNPRTHKIYFDYGDQTLDAMYKPLQQKVDVVMKAKKFTSKNWMTEYFPGKDHSEKSWKDRLNIPLEFLLKK